MQAAAMKRSYAGAQWDRLTADFQSPLTTGDAEMRTRLRTLRGRARQLERDDPYTKRYLSRLQDNVYDHHGITFSSLAGEWKRGPNKKLAYIIDELDAGVIENAYTEWKKNPFVTGDMNLNEGGRLTLRCTARDGDTFVRWVIGSEARNEFGIALQIMEGDICDDMRNEVVRTPYDGNSSIGMATVRMGVQVNGYLRPEGYWICKAYPGDQMWWNTDGFVSEFHDASEFLHIFKKERITQVRDCTWFHAVMRDMHLLNGYDEAAMVAARTGAAKMGWFMRDYQEPGDGYTGAQGELTDKSMDAEAGLIEDLSQTPGLKFEKWDPAYPHEQYDPFMKVRLRRIGAGLDVSYYAIANDLTEVNFSSIRSGVLEDREQYKATQSWWISKFECPVFLMWLKISLANGALKDPTSSTSLPFAKLDKFSKHKFRPRRWPWVDPKSDSDANKIAVDNRFKSRSEIIEETSENTFEQTILAIKHEQEFAEQNDVELPPVDGALPPVDPNSEDGDGKSSKKKPAKKD